VKRRLVVAFGDGIDDVGDLLVQVGQSRAKIAQFGFDMFGFFVNGFVDLFDEQRHDVVAEQLLLHLVEDITLDVFALDLFVCATLLAVVLVAAVLHKLTMKYFFIKVMIDTYIPNSNCHSTK
jgi:hypothetical protein